MNFYNLYNIPCNIIINNLKKLDQKIMYLFVQAITHHTIYILNLL